MAVKLVYTLYWSSFDRPQCLLIPLPTHGGRLCKLLVVLSIDNNYETVGAAVGLQTFIILCLDLFMQF